MKGYCKFVNMAINLIIVNFDITSFLRVIFEKTRKNVEKVNK